MIKLADILNQYGDHYILKHQHKLTSQHLKAVKNIRSCRTPELGGHAEHCQDCGETLIHHNSCRNRHCNQCQSLKQHKWVEERCTDALPVPYYHVVFTLPKELNPLFLAFPKVCLDLLFKTASKTVSNMASSKTFYSAQVGIITTLHTWGQNLEFHPHIHMMIPSVGLSKSGLDLIQLPKKFFLPVKTMSKVFRAKFASALRTAFSDGNIQWNDFESLINSLFNKEWVVYCKKPFASTYHLVKYLSAYTHKIAISNTRILSCENDAVSFRWKDYRDGKQKVMTLDVEEFIRRFLLHVLPKGFVRIRHYGTLSNANRNKKLAVIKRYMGVKLYRPAPRTSREILSEILGRDLSRCPVCGGILLPGPIPVNSSSG